MTTKKSRTELEVEYGRWNVEQSLVVWSALTKAVEKDKAIADIVVGGKAPSEAWKILNSIWSRTISAKGPESRPRKTWKDLVWALRNR